jgi:hypothetical protein
MKFYKLLDTILEELDPEVKDAWGDIVPHLDPPIFYVYFYMFSRGMVDITNKTTIKATDIEKALQRVYDMVVEDMEESYRLAGNKPNKYDYEWFDIRPINDEVGIVTNGEEIGAVVSSKKLKINQIEEILWDEQ